MFAMSHLSFANLRSNSTECAPSANERCDIANMILPNVQDEPRPPPARLVLLGARGVTAVVVGSGAWLGPFLIVRANRAIAGRAHPQKHSRRFRRTFFSRVNRGEPTESQARRKKCW